MGEVQGGAPGPADALGAGEDAPQLRVFNSESAIFAHEGETMTVASAVDPQTGEVVEAELAIEGVR